MEVHAGAGTQPQPTAVDFDYWRQAYDIMRDDERRNWDALCYAHFPEQAHGNGQLIDYCLELARIKSLGEKPRVLEVGGWRGDHAAALLKRHDWIHSWTNIEFCEKAARTPKTDDPRYTAVVPNHFRWWGKDEVPAADLLVLSHVIEHLSPEDLKGLLEATKHIPMVYCEAPLPEVGTNWEGYLGTHILPLSWKEVDDLFLATGWPVRTLLAHQDARFYRRAYEPFVG